MYRVVLTVMLLGVGSLGCSRQIEPGRGVGMGARLDSRKESADMLQADFQRLNDLPNSFSLNLQPPTVLLDARSSSDGQDVQAVVKQTPTIANGPWNVLEVVSKNVNFYSLGIRPGDTIKCYLFPDSETRTRQRLTGEVDAQMVTHEATDLVVAQVLDEHSVQIVGGVFPPRDLQVRVSEEQYLQFLSQAGLGAERLEEMRDAGKINEFGVQLAADRIPLDQLRNFVPTMQWPPRIEVWRVQDTRMRQINRALGGYARRGEPALGWEPTPDAEEIARLIESFNRWLRSQKANSDYSLPALLETLPESLRGDSRLGPMVNDSALASTTLLPHEGQLLQEAVWCRDVGQWAAGPDFDPLPRAKRLFDWVSRNVTLTTSPRVANYRPWHSLIIGRGTPEQRAWLFSSLCRQQRIASCVLSLPLEGRDDPWLWCGIVDHEKLYLFDPQLGLPVTAGPDVATWQAVKQDATLLRQLDLPDDPYPVSAESITGAVISLAADPLVISARAKSLEKQQSGDRALVLYEDLDARAQQLADLPSVDQVVLWDYPLVNLRQRLRLAAAATPLAARSRGAAASDFHRFAWVPRLWKARTLHLRGMVETEREAKKKGVLHDPINDHREAAQLYLHRRVRPSEKILAQNVLNDDRRDIYSKSKADATYWLGVLKLDQGSPRQAAAWLENDIFASPAGAMRRSGAKYNLARALEAMDQPDEAAALYAEDTSPQRFGNQLRATRLQAKSPEVESGK